jgi:hypothetical protein
MLLILFSENALLLALIAFHLIKRRRAAQSDVYQYTMIIDHMKKPLGKTLIFILK